ncbi:Large-conductance mechanosensitive channel [Candidatus Sumerlaea chitinivorans]|uniref:Large-conductance mechanosensitive channel n=1 Tax=Sumerlaea chitinivorans TaxID=2250252 RepID=A0A2Z4Y7A8_SUMC1|nr:Large-conductance mechanosensitive channel [Candidatus Sumerlaea chitinivorans]
MKTIWKEFREFAVKGNVVDMAVGVIIGAAFSKVVNSLVEHILMPPLSVIAGKMDFSSAGIVLSSQHFDTLEAAKKAGVPILYYGQFLNALVNFAIVSVALFFVVKAINRLRSAEAPSPTTQPCPFCKMTIPVGAKRCGHCTAPLPEA